MYKRVVITGATSSLGCALIDECIKQNVEVLAIANQGSSKMAWIPKNKLVKTIECSNENLRNFIIEGLEEYDVFFHLAWGSTAGEKARNQLQPQAMNIKYALDAVELASKLGCKVFIGTGSQAEYGRTDEVLTEDTIPHPETAYGMAKLCAGQMTRLACQQIGMKHIWTRILSAYGPKCQPQSVIHYTVNELLKGNTPSLSKGEQIWDFIYTGDVARALLLLAENGRNGEVYVIGSGKSKALKEYLLAVRDIVNPNIEMHFGEIAYGPNAVMHLACDTGKLVKDTGFKLETSFETGIKLTVEWIKDEQKKESKYFDTLF